jgi:hypothetical protein
MDRNSASAISGITGAIALVSAGFELWPVVATAGAISATTGAIASGHAFANGETLNGIADGLGAVLGGASLVSDLASHWAFDRTIVEAFTSDSDQAFDESLSTAEKLKGINRAARILDQGYGTAELANKLHEEAEKWAEANGYGCVNLEW